MRSHVWGKYLFMLISLVIFQGLRAADPEIIIPNAPQYLFEGSTIFFEVTGIDSNRLKWEFSDGLEKIGSKKVEHVFKGKGVFNVTVTDLEGKYPGRIQKQVHIVNDSREIVITGQHFFPGAPVKMEARNFLDWSVQWDFGDGPQQKLGVRVSHTYERSGSYIVKAVDFGGRGEKQFTKEIKISEDLRMIVVPQEIIAGESAQFQLTNAPGGDYTWEFSDGQRFQGLSIHTGAFKQPGPVTVTVKDHSGQFPPLSRPLLIKPDNRRLKSTLSFALPDEAVGFEAEDFRGSMVSWDFGDGSGKSNGSKNESHQFTRIGTYTVTARDFNGQSQKTFSTKITIGELSPDFQLTYLEMAFENGKYYQVAPLKNPPPAYYVKMTALGKGLLKGQWLLDGQTIGLFEVLLHKNQPTDLKGSRVVSLPRKDPGVHTLTLEFTNYRFPQRIPFVRYFAIEAEAIQLEFPGPDARVTVSSPGPVLLQWKWEDSFIGKKWVPFYQVSISKVPIRFLTDDQITWVDVGEKNQYAVDLVSLQDKDKGSTWFYWQVRALKPNGEVFTISDISSFKWVSR